MDAKRWTGKKRRTRAHVLEDLSRHHVEGYIVRRGFTCERITHDYGTDLLLFTYNDNGELENGHVTLQLKATDSPKVLRKGTHLAVEIELAHIRQWESEIYPVILVLYIARNRGRSFWLYVQRNLMESRSKRGPDLSDNERFTVTFQVPLANRFNHRTIERFRRFRDEILAQAKGVIRHDA